MKHILYITALLFILSTDTAKSQCRWDVGKLYQKRGAQTVISGETYLVIDGCDINGNPNYYYYKNCKKMVWYSFVGENQGYKWDYSRYPGNWAFFTHNGTWWYYVWFDYTVRVY